ncbi:hypothetical protein Hden_1195 [Hyphomicrobium denitrificans ATCC 51888]|uniref:Uncharacterized protein n=1 Tax=Hyphomicrobium denitrificans (strain ATCC 51888 / DSM 1869 / NCIMB 11706 / TK 0415) TaxID=582899 RepID=D8JVW9_HYPDA|nr:hypothetical protein [Hyphomicrobium denitrificans]ADJ23008.1 hypothetical protein Hden_1195 [Hyphomicrobium denitrificans ATCC 51888]
MFRTKPRSDGEASPAHGSNHVNIIGLGAALLSGTVLYFNGSYGYREAGFGLCVGFLGFAVVKDGAMSYAWSARGEYGRMAAGILSLIALCISCLAAIGAASSGKQAASDPKAAAIERYESARRTRDSADKRLAELGSVKLSRSQAEAKAADLLSKVDLSISRRTGGCTELAPKSNGPRQVAANREACQPWIEAKAVAATAGEIEVLTAKRDAAETVMSEGKPASADAQASTIAWLLSLFTKLHGIDSIQAFTNLMIGLGLEISSPLAWAVYASAKRGRGNNFRKSTFPKVEKVKSEPSVAAEQSDFVALDGPERFAEAKAALLGPNGPSAEILAFPPPNSSPNGSPNGPKPGNRARTAAKEAALVDLQGRIAAGERFGAQVELADRYDVAPSTMSEWLGEWERSGLIPPRMSVGRCKAVAGG